MELSHDEIILQIRKENKEAFELLFLYFGKYFTNFLKNIKNEMKILDIVNEDMLLILQEETHRIVKYYEMNKAAFLTFWKRLMERKICGMIRSNQSSISINLNHVSMDDTRIEYNFNDCNPLNTYLDYDEYNSCLNIVGNERGLKSKRVLKMWSEGYSYGEIGKKLHISVGTVGNMIRASLTLLKKLKDE